MIKLTLYNDADVIVNAELIESVERTPDTLLSLTNGKKIMVRESVEDVINKVITYRRIVAKSGRLFPLKSKNSLRGAVKDFERWT